MFHSGDRRQMRGVFVDAWRNYRKGAPLDGMAKIIVDVALRHPEYQPLLEDPGSLERDYPPEHGETNPYLHLSMHVAVEEQLAAGRPAGIRELFQNILMRTGDEHDARHKLMACLAETLWQAQRAQRPFDEKAYMQCLKACVPTR